MVHPNLADRVTIRPLAGARVQDGAGNFGRFLAVDGREVIWDEYWHRRLLDGSVEIVAQDEEQE